MHHSSAFQDLPTPLEALLARAARTPEATAFIFDDEPWSCHRLATESASLADVFRHRGIGPGDRVALHMFNLSELALAYLACWRIGAIAVPMNTRYKAAELTAMIERVRPALYLGQDELYEGVRDVPADVLAPDARFVVGFDTARDGARPWAELITSGKRPADPESSTPVDRDAPAVLLSTSGTTGQSKLVVWTPCVLAGLQSSAADRGTGAEDVLVLHLPMMHASGITFFCNCLLTGARMILLPRFEPGTVLDAIASHRGTTFVGLPFMAAELVRSQRMRPRAIGSIRFAMTGGDVCTEETHQAFATVFDRPLLSMWASTEEPSGSLPGLRAGPLTRLTPDTEAQLIDDDGIPVKENETGEMLLRSPGTTPGYWLGPGRIEPLPEGWFHTGDLMRREPDGQLRYMGRTKDLIVRNGSNISPVEIETVLRRQSGVADAAVAGLLDPELGQRVGAVLVLADGTSPDAVPGILAGVRAALADYKVPEALAVVEAIPRNALTKVDRTAVAKLIEREQSS